MRQTAAMRRHALVPKPRLSPEQRRASDPEELWWHLMANRERRALQVIAANADLVQVPGAPDHLLIQATPGLLETLALVGEEMQDREPEEDREPDLDGEPSIGAPEGAQVFRHQWVTDAEDDGLSRGEGEDSGSLPPAGAKKSLEAFTAERQAGEPPNPIQERAEIQRLRQALGKRPRRRGKVRQEGWTGTGSATIVALVPR